MIGGYSIRLSTPPRLSAGDLIRNDHWMPAHRSLPNGDKQQFIAEIKRRAAMALKLADVSFRASKECKAGELTWKGSDIAGDLGLPQLDG